MKNSSRQNTFSILCIYFHNWIRFTFTFWIYVQFCMKFTVSSFFISFTRFSHLSLYSSYALLTRDFNFWLYSFYWFLFLQSSNCAQLSQICSKISSICIVCNVSMKHARKIFFALCLLSNSNPCDKVHGLLWFAVRSLQWILFFTRARY